MTFLFLGSVLFLIWHTTLPVCQGPSTDIPLLNRLLLLTVHWLVSSANCDLLVCMVVTRFWHVIDIDRKSNALRFEPCGTPGFG